ncbi:MAG: UDP-N-acetylmuramoyl-L-alanine--D-glutamate ligase, partial [Rikenellaceae bacterium]|nr:UDP-N-acetylmuramoyl-L-alanine--D-glutamate ligase [Rikenellaceae bacterium]
MKRIVVLGGGESGYGSAVLARVKGFDVFLSDSGTITPAYKTKLEEWEIPYEEGGHTAELILNADLIVKSPGIPDKASMIRAIREKGIKIVSEIEFAGWYNRARTICITGSNGKTTTTTLTYEILKQGGLNVGLGGNIGASFAYQVATEEHDWYVLELSSFQLDGMFDFRADVAVLMNITPDHLDRYDYQLQNYADSKFRVIQNQGKDQAFIYCDDDP